MPTPELMTWVPSQRRWTRMYRGRRYYISARQLGTAETKEASLHAANQWWRDKQADLDHAYRENLRTPAPMEDLAAASMGLVPSPDLFGNIRLLLEQALLREEEDRLAGKPLKPFLPGLPPGEQTIEILVDDPGVLTDGTEAITIVPEPEEPDEAERIRRREIMALLERLLFGDAPQLPQDVAEQLPPARVQQVERAVKELRGEAAADPERTVGALAEKWLKNQKSRASVGQITPIRFASIKSCLAHFIAFAGGVADVSTVHAELAESFYHFCLSKMCDKQQGREGGWSEDRAKKVFETAKTFIRWLWEQGKIEMPRNLNRENFKFNLSAKPIATWTPEEIQRVIGEAPGKLKLTLLLMLNCGFTQKDASDLQDSEVDWQRGSITRKRSKTKRNDNVPVVTYKLWPLTFQLLKQHRSGKGHVLLTQTGRPFVRSSIVNGKVQQADMFITKYRKLCKRLDFHKPMKQLRKTSATLLEDHPVFGRLTTLFLGHSPRSVKDRNYAAPPQALFDEAVTWLGRQLGFMD